MGNRLFPIKFDLMYRSILGRTTPDVEGGDTYRGHRVIIVEGDIVGVPHYAPDPERFRTLMASALGFAEDGDPAIRIHFSSLPTTNAFDQQRSNESMKDYFNSTFVIVRPTSGSEDVDADDDSNDVICVNFFALQPYADAICPEFVNNTEQRDIDGDATFSTSGGGEIESVMDGEYELTEDVHYTYDPVTGDLVILDAYLDYIVRPSSGSEDVDADDDYDDDLEGSSVVLTVTFVGCEPYDITISGSEDVDADDDDDDDDL